MVEASHPRADPPGSSSQLHGILQLRHLLRARLPPRQPRGSLGGQERGCPEEESNQCHQHDWSLDHLAHGTRLQLLDRHLHDQRQL